MTWRFQRRAGGRMTVVDVGAVKREIRNTGKTAAQAIELMRELKVHSPRWNPLPPVIRIANVGEFSWRANWRSRV